MHCAAAQSAALADSLGFGQQRRIAERRLHAAQIEPAEAARARDHRARRVSDFRRRFVAQLISVQLPRHRLGRTSCQLCHRRSSRDSFYFSCPLLVSSRASLRVEGPRILFAPRLPQMSAQKDSGPFHYARGPAALRLTEEAPPLFSSPFPTNSQPLRPTQRPPSLPP